MMTCSPSVLHITFIVDILISQILLLLKLMHFIRFFDTAIHSNSILEHLFFKRGMLPDHPSIIMLCNLYFAQ